MNTRRSLIVWIGMGLLLAETLYPPWTSPGGYSGYGWFFLSAPGGATKLDVTRLFIEWLAVAVFVVAVLFVPLPRFVLLPRGAGAFIRRVMLPWGISLFVLFLGAFAGGYAYAWWQKEKLSQQGDIFDDLAKKYGAVSSKKPAGSIAVDPSELTLDDSRKKAGK